jgi:hypothetical protein
MLSDAGTWSRPHHPTGDLDVPTDAVPPDGIAPDAVRPKAFAPGAELRLEFGRAGNAAPFRREGWSDPEADETWCVGQASLLVLPAPAESGPHMLVLRLRPHVVAGRLLAQRLRITANGVPVGDFTLGRRGVRACSIPASALAGHAALQLRFETPDAARPCDHGGQDSRALALAVASLTLHPDRFGPTLAEPQDPDAPAPASIDAVMRADRLPLDQLMLKFESLGQNCEFGLVQRACQAEPLSLLRFASTPLANLLAALDAGFAGMGTPQTVKVEMSANGREFMVTDSAYGVVYHPWVASGEMTAEALHRRESRRAPLLVRKLLEDLAAADKIFVFKGMGALAEEVAFPLAAALRRHGRTTLLAMTLADAAHRPGTVTPCAPGLLMGYVDRFAPGEDAQDFLLDQWVAVCRAALRLTATAAA